MNRDSKVTGIFHVFVAYGVELFDYINLFCTFVSLS